MNLFPHPGTETFHGEAGEHVDDKDDDEKDAKEEGRKQEESKGAKGRNLPLLYL